MDSSVPPTDSSTGSPTRLALAEAIAFESGAVAKLYRAGG